MQSSLWCQDFADRQKYRTLDPRCIKWTNTAKTPMYNSIFQDQSSPFSPALPADSPLSLTWKASHSNPHPHFQNCTQNDIMAMHCSLGSFHKKTIVYFLLLMVISFTWLSMQSLKTSVFPSSSISSICSSL